MNDDRIANVVCYFRLALVRADGTIAPVHLNLLRIYREMRDRWPLNYDPQQFGSANIRIECRSLGLKNVAALIFSTGKVVCPGSSSPLSGLIMAHLITAEVSRMLDGPFCMRDFRLPNLVGRVHTDPVDVKTLASVLGDAKSRYEPTGAHPFPACFVFAHKMSDKPNNIVYLVYASGKIVVTGCRSEEEVFDNMRQARELCSHFPVRQYDPDDAPSTLLAADRAMLDAPEKNLSRHLAIESSSNARTFFSAGTQYMDESSRDD